MKNAPNAPNALSLRCSVVITNRNVVNCKSFMTNISRKLRSYVHKKVIDNEFLVGDDAKTKYYLPMSYSTLFSA